MALRYNQVRSQLLFGAQKSTGRLISLVRERFRLTPPQPQQKQEKQKETKGIVKYLYSYSCQISCAYCYQHLSSMTYEAQQDCETATTTGIMRKKDFKELVRQNQHLKDEGLTIRKVLEVLEKSELPTVMTSTSDKFLIVPMDAMVDPNVLEEVPESHKVLSQTFLCLRMRCTGCQKDVGYVMADYLPATSQYFRQEDYLYLKRDSVILEDTLECEKVESPKVNLQAQLQEALEKGWDRYRVAEGGLVEVSERIKATYETMEEDLDNVEKFEKGKLREISISTM